ncbi:M1 family peptidase [candidate division KSB1 bacterium]|nr:M1 family metallopeptidase [candidate division KSB1 bacterium]RQW01112.1 MAG: M1 family peptidase [candidate division KSB1 bacterium]
MKRNLLFFISLFFFHVALEAQDVPCERVVSYQIHATLNPDNKTVTGTQQLSWTNAGSASTQELYFHLYLNAFKNTQSTFFKEMVARSSSLSDYISRFNQGGWGYCDVRSIAIAGTGTSTSLLSQFMQPDDGNTRDETVFKVDLPRPIAPGDSVTLDIEFVSQLPYRAPRTGYVQDYFFVAQWFPKIGVWSNDEWNCHQFHAHTEFFADYGDYDVHLTVPSDYVVGASGVLSDSTTNGNGTTTYRFLGECIHDFAWTASPRFKVALRTFEHPELPNVRMKLLYQPNHRRFVDAFFDATENTLKYLGLWYIPYPYPQITIVDAACKSSTAGMEYPTLFTTGVDLFVARGSQEPLGLTIHECAHQFFYGIIGSNEFEHAWLDEGFTTYATSRCLNVAYGPGAYSKTYLARGDFGIPFTFPRTIKDQRDWIVENHRNRGRRDYMDKMSWEFVDYLAYRNNAYEKPALMLWTLENYLGEAVFGDIMKAYANRWAFKHPQPEDFFNIVNDFAPEDMSWFFDKLMYEPGVVDYAVGQITSKAPVNIQGYFGSGENMEKRDQDAEQDIFESQVHIKRLGEIQLPVEILVTFENGETITERWNGVEPYKIFYYANETKVEMVEVDPYHKIWLDVNPVNNGKYRTGNSLPAFRWGASWLFWLQDLLEMIAILS